jgi:SAM-dependent methyltransferase
VSARLGLSPQPSTGPGRAAEAPQPGDVRSIDWALYDFVDIGCSAGGSLQHAAKRFGAERGIGIDINPEKVAAARERGLHAVAADIADVGGRGVVRFATMMQTLEHLPDLDAVHAVLARAAELATDFLYIHHPSFEDEHYLLARDLRLYYHNWSGHPCHALCADFFDIFERLGLMQYHVRPLQPIEDSSHPAVLPVSAPKNQHEYDESIHGAKPELRFDRLIYRHLEFFVALRPIEPAAWRRIVTG